MTYLQLTLSTTSCVNHTTSRTTAPNTGRAEELTGEELTDGPGEGEMLGPGDRLIGLTETDGSGLTDTDGLADGDADGGLGLTLGDTLGTVGLTLGGA